MKKTYDLILSIGSRCKISYNLRRRKLQLESFPFDWIYVPRISLVDELFASNFQNFFLEENLRLRSKQPRFDEVDDLATGMYSAHDFATDKSIHECYQEVMQKYKRRILKLNSRISKAERILMVYGAEDNFFSDEEIIRQFALLQKRFFSKKLDLLYFYLPEKMIAYDKTQLTPNVVKISFQKERVFEWQGNTELFDESLEDVKLALKTKLVWYTSQTYLKGLQKKYMDKLLKFLSNLIFVKKYRKVFREKCLEKKNHFN